MRCQRLHQIGRHDVPATILLETVRVILRAKWIELAPPGSITNLQLANTPVNQRRLDKLGAPVRQHKVIKDVAASVCVALDPKMALCRNLEKWPIGGDLKFWPRRLVVEVGLPGCKPESSGDERREMVWKWGRAWCVPARSVVSTPRRRC